MWYRHIDISTPENLYTALAAHHSVFSNDAEMKEIIAAAGTLEIKARLTETTARVVEDQGAFG
jgi:2-hydroxychromene-2-carboxylate isomerase